MGGLHRLGDGGAQLVAERVEGRKRQRDQVKKTLLKSGSPPSESAVIAITLAIVIARRIHREAGPF